MQCLLQRHFHNLLVDAFDLDVHLQSSDTRRGTRDFKVHITQVILITQDIGENRKLIAFLHQTHRDTCDRSLQRYACRHHRE